MIIKLFRDGNKLVVEINGRVVEVNGLGPADFLLIGLAYGLGVRFMEKFNSNEYSIRCEISDGGIVCEGPCGGFEDRCLIFRVVTRGLLRFNCSETNPS